MDNNTKTTIPPGTIGKLGNFANKINDTYKKLGYAYIPLNGEEQENLIKIAWTELYFVFARIWGTEAAEQLLYRFHEKQGNVHQFYLGLDLKSRLQFANTNW